VQSRKEIYLFELLRKNSVSESKLRNKYKSFFYSSDFLFGFFEK